MTTHDFAAKDDGSSSSLKDHRVDRFILFPQYWNSFKSPIRLAWARVKLDKGEEYSVPDDKRGVYTFIAEPNIESFPPCHYPLYVGKVETSDFRTRFRSYLDEPKKHKARAHIQSMIRRWKSHLWFYYCSLPADIKVSDIEDDLIIALLPPMNRQFPAKITKLMALTFS